MKRIAIIMILVFCMFACNKKENQQKNGNNQNNEIIKKENSALFIGKSVDKVISDFEAKSKENKVQIEPFEKIDYDNKNFYHSKIVTKDKSTYTLEYNGIEVIGMFTKIDMVTGADLGLIENIVINLIEVSDENIEDEEARKLYAEILTNMKENQLVSALMYKNGLTYGIQIEKETGELIFFIQ